MPVPNPNQFIQYPILITKSDHASLLILLKEAIALAQVQLTELEEYSDGWYSALYDRDHLNYLLNKLQQQLPELPEVVE